MSVHASQTEPKEKTFMNLGYVTKIGPFEASVPYVNAVYVL
jgi:hypothetical protein